MRPSPLTVLLGALLLAAGLCTPVGAAPLEYHVGLYSSYEYTDNYRGTAHDEEGESIFEVGPSAQVIYTSGISRLDLSGRLTRSFHQEFSDDDSTEVLLDSSYTRTTQTDTLLFGYGYTRTNRTTVLSDVTGVSRIQTARFNYTRTFTSRTSGGIGYTYSQEDNEEEEDLVSHGVTANLSQQLTELTALRITGGYASYRYDSMGDEFDPDGTGDTWTARGGLSLERTMTRKLTMSVDGEYEHEAQEDDETPDSDITSAFLTGRYAFTPATRLMLSGGYSWLTMEDMDSEQSYAARGELRSESPSGTITLRVSREYVAEFTTDRYGVYEARSAYLTWEWFLLRDLTLTTNITYEERNPVSGTEVSDLEGQEEDYSGLISLRWNPVRYLIITPGYERYEQHHEYTDTEKENRYRVVVEVRY